VVFAVDQDQRDYLLLRRIASYGGFWQFVTGSLEESETHRNAAIREVEEETGIRLDPASLIDLGLTNRFEILPRWRPKYAPDVTHNEEVCFAARVNKGPVRLDAVEHDAFCWLPYRRALEILHWESNKRALHLTEMRQSLS
jgi:dATP pyrophosphohydrolase